MCQVEGGCWQFIGKTKDNPKWGKEFSLKHDTIDLKFISSNFSSRAEVKFCLQWFWKVILQSLLKISRTQCFWGQLLLEWISVLLVCSDYWALTHSLFTGYKGFQLPARKPCIFFFSFKRETAIVVHLYASLKSCHKLLQSYWLAFYYRSLSFLLRYFRHHSALNFSFSKLSFSPGISKTT